jgi:hypothetical protein
MGGRRADGAAATRRRPLALSRVDAVVSVDSLRMLAADDRQS